MSARDMRDAGAATQTIVVKHDVALTKVNDATFCVSGFKTIFNQAHLSAHGGVYDMTTKRWVFSSYDAAHAAWTHVVSRSEEAHAKNLAAHATPLPAFKSKKPKSAVQLDEVDNNEDNEGVGGARITGRKRKPRAPSPHAAHASDNEAKDDTNEQASSDEDTPISVAAALAKRPRAPTTKKLPHEQQLSLTDTSGQDQYFAKPPKAPRKARASAPAEKKPRKPTKKQQEQAAAAAAAEAAAAAAAVTQLSEFELDDSRGDASPPNNNEDDAYGGDAAAVATQTKTSAATAKRFKKNAITPAAAKRAAAAAASAPEAWELDCEIVDAKVIDDADKPMPMPSRRRVHADLLPPSAHPADFTTTGTKKERTLTREQCALLYDVGAPCDVDVTRHTEWNQPEANQTAWTTTTVTTPMPCIVGSTSVEDGRICMTLRPRDARTFVMTLGVDGYLWVVLTPEDSLTFRSQKLAAVRDRNMHNCTFELSYCTIWDSVLRDPLRRIGFALHL